VRVTIAFAGAPEGEAGQTVTVDDARGRAMLRDGHARLTAAGPFDPTDHNVAEVNAYLDAAPDVERARVLSAEVSGRNRAGIVNR